IVELGFASGAAVAHALAMQSGGALRTEYGFALGVNPTDGDESAEETRAGLPKLRLAATAVAPAAPPDLEPVEEAEPVVEESAPVEEPETVEEAEPVAEAVPLGEDAEPVEEADETEDPADGEALDVAPDEAEVTAETPVAGDADPLELEKLREEIERLEAALAGAKTATGEQEQHQAEVEKLERALSEAQVEHEQDLARLREEHERATTEIERLQAALAEAGGEREQELARLREERDEVATELERLHTALAEAQTSAAEHERRLAEEQERHAGERDELNTQHERLQEELGNALERLAVVGPAAAERDELRAEVDRLHRDLSEVRESSAVELRRVVEERDGLKTELEEARELLQHAERVRESQIALEAERDRVVAELERLQSSAAEAQAE